MLSASLALLAPQAYLLHEARTWPAVQFCLRLYTGWPSSNAPYKGYKSCSCFSANHLARNAMTGIRVIRNLLLVAVMASRAGPDAGPGAPAPTIHCGVTRFVCVNCTETGHLSSRGLFLNRAGVRRHISATKACFAADRGFKEIRVEARAGDVMAGAGGAAGPAPDVRHQPPGTTVDIY